MAKDHLFALKGVVQNYSWGGFDYIPHLLGVENKEHKPYAEYWLGAHPNHSGLLEETNHSLVEHIENAPEDILGKRVASRFGGLPYLLKVLDVRQMLSI